MPTTEDAGRLGDPVRRIPSRSARLPWLANRNRRECAPVVRLKLLTRQNDGADRSDSIYSTREKQCEASGVL